MEMRPLNHDVIRGILAWASLSDINNVPSTPWPTDIEGFQGTEEDYDTVVSKHILYLVDKQWIEIEEHPEGGAALLQVQLRSGGWDHLDEIRDRTTWERIKKLISDKGAVVTFETIKAGTGAITKGIITGYVGS